MPHQVRLYDAVTEETTVVWAIEARDTIRRFPERFTVLDELAAPMDYEHQRAPIDEFNELQRRERPRPAGSSERRPHWDASRGARSATPAGTRDLSSTIPPLDSRRRRSP